MLRSMSAATAILVFVLTVHAAGQPNANVKQFSADIEQLNALWESPKMDFAPGITGRIYLQLKFKKDSTVGQATVLGFVSRVGIFVKPGPSWIAELKEMEKERFIVLAETKDDQRRALTEIAYEIQGGRLNMKNSRPLSFEKGGKLFDLSGEWARYKADKK